MDKIEAVLDLTHLQSIAGSSWGSRAAFSLARFSFHTLVLGTELWNKAARILHEKSQLEPELDKKERVISFTTNSFHILVYCEGDADGLKA